MAKKAKGGKKAGNGAGGKEKTKKDTSGDGEIEDVKAQLLLEAKEMKKKLIQEEEQFRAFQEQREKLNYFWVLEKKKLEDKKIAVREKQIELEDLHQRQQVEVTAYKLQVKKLMHGLQDELVASKTSIIENLRAEEAASMEAESHVKYDKTTLRKKINENELNHDDYIKAMKQENDRQIMELRQKFERKTKELQKHEEKKSSELREYLENSRKAEVAQIERRKDMHANDLMTAHEKAFTEIKNYYYDITQNNLDLIKSLKDEVAELKSSEATEEKLMREISQENKQMMEPLRKTRTEVEQFRIQLEEYSKIQAKLQAEKAASKVLEDELKALQWELEILTQRYNVLDEEKADLYDKYHSTVYDVQQKAGFKNLLLEKKTKLLDSDLEKADGYISELAQRVNQEEKLKGNIDKKMDDIIEDKNKVIDGLAKRIASAIQSNNSMVQKYTQKLIEYGISIDELGFVPKLVSDPLINS